MLLFRILCAFDSFIADNCSAANSVSVIFAFFESCLLTRNCIVFLPLNFCSYFLTAESPFFLTSSSIDCTIFLSFCEVF